jgi:hypothetical protein
MRHHPITTKKTPFMWMRKTPPGERSLLGKKSAKGKSLFHLKLRNRQLKTQYRRNKYHLLSEGLLSHRHLLDPDGRQEKEGYQLYLGIFMVNATL